MTHTHQIMHLANDSMNALKRDLQVFMLKQIFFTSHKPNAQKIMKKKKLNVKLLNFVEDMKQMTTLTFKLKPLVIFSCLLMNNFIYSNYLKIHNSFYDISQDSSKDMVDKQVDSISLTDEEFKHIEYSSRVKNLLIYGGNIVKKNSLHLIFTRQLLTKQNPVKNKLFVLFFC